jgi:hypothetical protein
MATGGSMELIKWLTNKDLDNAPSLVVVIIVVCVVIFETTVLAKMFLPAWLQKKDGSKPSDKKPPVKNSHLAEILAKLDDIDKRLDETSKRLDKHYEYIKEAVIQSGVSVVWTPGVPFIELVRAALLNVALGANGNLREKLTQAIIKRPSGREDYQSELNSFIKERKKREEKISDHFYKTIDWIEKRLDAGY